MHGNRPRLAAVASLCLGAGALSLAAPARAIPPREQTLAVLATIPASGGPKVGLEVAIDGTDPSHPGELRVGDRLHYRFRARTDAYLTVLHIDSQGLTTVLYPGAVDPDSRIAAGVDKVFPAELTIAPPLGREDLIAIATPAPVSLEDLGLAPAPGQRLVQVESGRASALAGRLRDRLASIDPATIAITETAMRVRPAEAGLTARQIIDFWITRTRSVERPRLDLPIEFATGSAELDARARRILDEMGEALTSPQLADQRVVVGGHTDDVGSEEYNQRLSEERAASVRDYLVRNRGVSPDRLETRGYGETRPKESGTDPEARQANRRVEFEAAP